MSEGYGCAVVVAIAAIVGVVGSQRGCAKDPVPANQVTVTRSVPVSVPVSQRVTNVFKKDKDQSATPEVEVVQTKFETPDFTYGTTPFWILAAIVVIGMIACIEYEQGLVGAVCLLIFLGIIQWAGRSDPLGYVQQHPLNSFLFLVGYYLVGVAWGFVKWYLFLIDKKTEAIEYKEKWLEDNGVSDPAEITDTLRKKWATQAYKFTKPTARANKYKIINWISYWPLSVLWSFLADFVKRIGTIIYNHIARSLQAMSDRVWKGVDHDLI